MRPRTGKALLVAGTVACVALAAWNETVTTESGSVGLRLLMPGFAAVFLVRLAGVAAAERDGRGEMAWSWRVASWVLAVGNAFVFGMLGTAG